MSIDAIIATIPDKSAAERRKMRDNALRHAAEGNPRRPEALKLLAALDAAETGAIRAARAETDARAPADRVVHAFTVEPPTETEQKVIQVLLDHPGLSSEGLSRKLGWGGQIWHTHFGKMCQRRELHLWPAQPSAVRDAKFWSGILATWDPATAAWTMKPEAADGFARLGIVAGAAR